MVTVNRTGGGACRSGHAHWHTSPTHLDRHDLVAGLVHHLVDGAVGPAADLAQVFQVLGGEVPVLLRDLQLSRRLDAVRPEPLSRKKRIRRYGGCCGSASPACDGVTHMCGFWKGGPAVFSVNLVMGLIGGLAKFSFRALRLPVGRRAGGAAGANVRPAAQEHLPRHRSGARHTRWWRWRRSNLLTTFSSPSTRHN